MLPLLDTRYLNRVITSRLIPRVEAVVGLTGWVACEGGRGAGGTGGNEGGGVGDALVGDAGLLCE